MTDRRKQEEFRRTWDDRAWYDDTDDKDRPLHVLFALVVIFLAGIASGLALAAYFGGVS